MNKLNKLGTRVSRNTTLLFSYAHPDDESFGPGGTIARYADAGVRVILVCATLGEAGKAGDPPICTPEELPEVRRQELMAAAKVLGIARVELLGYRDKELERVSFAEGVERLVSLLKRYSPDSVVTFPPGGISGHPDHLVIQRWTLAAVQRYQREGAPVRLFYHTAPEFFRLFNMQPHHELDRRYNVRIEITRWLDRKIQALRCHRSQHLSADRLISALESVRERGLSEPVWEHYLHIDPRTGEEAPPPFANELVPGLIQEQ